MSSQPSAPVLLGPASLLLQTHAYTTESVALGAASTLLLAENDYFALGLMEFGTADDLPAAETISAARLAELVSSGAGAKSWDAYLVLLSSASQANETMPEAVATIVYNTRFFRRIVRWNVQPDENSLSRALRPFLPFTTTQAGLNVSPLQLLTRSLTSYGISADDAAQAIARWRMSGDDDD